MIRLFFIIFTMFVFSLPTPAQVRFYRMRHGGITGFLQFGDEVAWGEAYCNKYPRRSLLEARYSKYGILQNIQISNKGYYTQTYPANKCKFLPLGYAVSGLLYTDGNVCEFVKKREKVLLKIKNVKLCTVYEDHFVDLGTNWTSTQFFANAFPSDYQLDFWSKVYNNRHCKKMSLTSTAIRYPYRNKATIAVLEVTFTNGQKVKLKIYDDPAWANARPGMLVERYKLRQITIYELK